MKDQLILSILSRCNSIMPIETARELRRIIESEMMQYDVTIASTAIVPYAGAQNQLRIYLASKRLDGLAESTLEQYEMKMTHFLASIPKPVEQITSMEIRAYLAAYQASGVKLTTLATMQSTLKAFFNWLEAEDIIPKSPMRKLNAIKTPSRVPKYLTAEQMEKLRLSCRSLRDRAMLETYYSTGSRVSELVNANYTEINFSNGTLQAIGKGNKERTVYINSRAMVHLKKYLEARTDSDKALFVGERFPHERLKVKAVQEVFARLGKDAEIPQRVHPHLMRHTIATTMLRNGTDLSKIQQMLGHANPYTTQIYAVTDDASVHDAHRRCS